MDSINCPLESHAIRFVAPSFYQSKHFVRAKHDDIKYLRIAQRYFSCLTRQDNMCGFVMRYNDGFPVGAAPYAPNEKQHKAIKYVIILFILTSIAHSNIRRFRTSNDGYARFWNITAHFLVHSMWISQRQLQSTF